MCNRVVQNGVEIKPGGKATVLMRGPQGEFELPFTEAVFGGPAKTEPVGESKLWSHPGFWQYLYRRMAKGVK